MKTIINRTKEHFKTLQKVLNRFQNRPIIKQYHTISDYKRYVDEYRQEVISLGIYNDDDFNTIKFIKFHNTLKLIFVIDDKSNDLKITAGIVENVYPFKVTKYILDFQSFKKAINNFNRELLNKGYDYKKPFSFKLLKDTFNKHFNNSNLITKFDFDSAITIIKLNSEKEIKELSKAKAKYTKKQNEYKKVYNEIQKKVKAYETQLIKDLNLSKYRDDKIKAENNLKNIKEQTKSKILYEYKKDKRFIFSFNETKVKNFFKNIFYY